MIEAAAEPVWLLDANRAVGELRPRLQNRVTPSLRVDGFDQLVWCEDERGHMVAGLWARNGTEEDLKELAQSLVCICEF